jgi:hypothetical protein
LAFLLGNLFAAKLLEIPRHAPAHWRAYRWLFGAMTLYMLLLASPYSAVLIDSAMPIATLGALAPVLMALLYARQAKLHLKLYALA